MVAEGRGERGVGGALSLRPRRRGWSFFPHSTHKWWFRPTFMHLGCDDNLCLLDATQRLHTLRFLLAGDFATENVT